MLPSIQVLGVRAFHKTESLKHAVEEALLSLGVKLDLELITGLEAMVDAKITAIPALVIDGHVLVQGEVPSKPEILEIVRGALKSKVVVPIDFSESSRYALQYAEDLAEAFFLRVKVLHVYPQSAIPPDSLLNNSALDWLDELHEGMRSFIKPQTPRFNARMEKLSVSTAYEIRPGKVEPELRRESRSPETRLIVMANSGDHDIGNRWFGSTAVKVARQADCPVLLVPPEFRFKGFRRITVATDKDNVSDFHRKWLAGLCQPDKGIIHYVHIRPLKITGVSMLETEGEIVNGIFKEPAESVEEGLLHFSKKMDSDLIVLISRHRNAWQELFHKSCTQNLAQKCPIPILVVPPSPDSESTTDQD
ncbi:MAG: universal stress protein [Saprospiraceae bacterium]|nr:universal stress protein [Saprospiraceae bacterium]